ncbi:MAG TPA: hypothetical protein ENK35_09820 [Candidatus Tenderia sp.]|nr:hypothetical protein [Candidatus Tenderia sp.]
MKDRSMFLSMVIGAVLVTGLIWGLSVTGVVSPSMVVTIAILSVVVLPVVLVIAMDRKNQNRQQKAD